MSIKIKATLFKNMWIKELYFQIYWRFMKKLKECEKIVDVKKNSKDFSMNSQKIDTFISSKSPEMLPWKSQ